MIYKMKRKEEKKKKTNKNFRIIQTEAKILSRVSEMIRPSYYGTRNRLKVQYLTFQILIRAYLLEIGPL